MQVKEEFSQYENSSSIVQFLFTTCLSKYTKKKERERSSSLKYKKKNPQASIESHQIYIYKSGYDYSKVISCSVLSNYETF